MEKQKEGEVETIQCAKNDKRGEGSKPKLKIDR